MAERVIECEVPVGLAPVRADKYFASEFEDVSRARLQRAFESGGVSFEGEVIGKRFKLTGPGRLRAVLDEPDAGERPEPAAIPLSVVHEDESLIVVDKAAGMVTHPGSGTGNDTLVHALLHHCGERLSTVGAPDRPGIVHRLDRETSGLIVVAKTDAAHHKLAAAFAARDTFKRYTALSLGVPRRESGSCRDPIGRHPVVRTRMAVLSKGREAHTDWKVVESFGGRASLVHCVIHTGRTHQIRVHLSAMGLPLLGDTTYGFKANRLKGLAVPRVMLHATELSFDHPASGKRVSFASPLPEDFEAVLGALRNGL